MIKKGSQVLKMLPPPCTRLKSTTGFTLAELLISLAILGVIATFTIPKILSTQQNTAWNSQAKEVASTVSAGLQKALLEQGKGGATTFDDMMQFTNYVARDTTSTIDNAHTGATLGCWWLSCYRFHSGGIVYASGATTLGGTATTNALAIYYDPDGKVTDGTTNGPGKSVLFYIYSNGLVRTRGTTLPNTCDGGQCWASPGPSADPPWFNWN